VVGALPVYRQLLLVLLAAALHPVMLALPVVQVVARYW